MTFRHILHDSFLADTQVANSYSISTASWGPTGSYRAHTEHQKKREKKEKKLREREKRIKKSNFYNFYVANFNSRWGLSDHVMRGRRLVFVFRVRGEQKPLLLTCMTQTAVKSKQLLTVAGVRFVPLLQCCSRSLRFLLAILVTAALHNPVNIWQKHYHRNNASPYLNTSFLQAKKRSASIAFGRVPDYTPHVSVSYAKGKFFFYAFTG